MDGGPPQLVAIDHDDYHAEDIGKSGDGRQFFLTTPFEPMRDNQEGREFLALYIFDKNGNLSDSVIDDLGPRASLNFDRRRRLGEQRLRDLGQIQYCRIEIAPFSARRFGTDFGLIVRAPEDIDEVRVVEAQPGNYMAYFAPWDSGNYDT